MGSIREPDIPHGSVFARPGSRNLHQTSPGTTRFIDTEGTEMIDALRSYFQLAEGMAESAVARARDAATTLVAQGLETRAEDLGSQVTVIAEDLIEQGRTNREVMLGIVRTEVDRAVGRMGFVREEELAAVRKHVQRLEQELMAQTGRATALATTAASTAAGKAAEAGSAVRDAAVKAVAATGITGDSGQDSGRDSGQSAASSATGPAPTAAAAPVKTPAVKKAAAKKAPAKKTARKAPVKKAAAKKAPAEKTAKADE